MSQTNWQSAVAKASQYGYRLLYTPKPQGAPVESNGWADHAHKTLYVFTQTQSDTALRERVKTKIAYHEIGHARWTANHLTASTWRQRRAAAGYPYPASPALTDQHVEEDYCEIYSRCIGQLQTGVGYSVRAPKPASTDGTGWGRLQAQL